MLNLFNRNMNSKIDTNIYLLVILILGALVCYFEPYMIPVVAIVFGLTYYFSRRHNSRYRSTYGIKPYSSRQQLPK